MRLRKTPAAEQDLLAIWDYIAVDSPSSADRFHQRLQDRFKQLLRQPHSGESQERFRPRLRSVIEGSYIIFYEPCPDEILIYRILHGARRWEDLIIE
jgi:toxin ParE1/3/4